MSWITTPIKSKADLNAMNKQKVIDYAVELGKNLQALTTHLFHPENGVISKLQSQLEVSSRVNALLNDRLLRLERNNNLNSQYIRKETLEIHKFPKDVPDSALEEKVLELFNAVKEEEDEPLTAADFHACHRLANRERVIIKFTHRKRMRAVIKSRNKFANPDTKRNLNIGRIYVVESLAGPYKYLLYQCQQLKAGGAIHDCWFFNGNINVVLVEKGERHHIAHSADIMKLLDITEDVFHEIVSKKY